MTLKARLALGALLGIAFSVPAGAAPAIVEDAKDECIVGERNDGYLGVIDEDRATNDLRREVASINQRRKAAYARTAANTPGASIEDAAVVAAQELINRARSGQCVQDESGDWVQL